MGAHRIFCKGCNQGSGEQKSPSGVQGQSPGGGLGAKSAESDCILLKMTYRDVVFLYTEIIFRMKDFLLHKPNFVIKYPKGI